MWQVLLRAFVFVTPIAAVAVVLVRHIWDAVSTDAEINPWVLALGSVLGWLGVQLTLLKFVDALGFEIWPARKAGGDDSETGGAGRGDRPPSGPGDGSAASTRKRMTMRAEGAARGGFDLVSIGGRRQRTYSTRLACPATRGRGGLRQGWLTARANRIELLQVRSLATGPLEFVADDGAVAYVGGCVW